MFWKKARKLYSHLTAEDRDIKKYLEISTEFQASGYQGLVGYIQDMGHRWIAQQTLVGLTLEIGFGSGRHSLFFTGRKRDYYVSEYSTRYCHSELWKNFKGYGICCDARNLPYCKSVFQTVISIYNLEHITELKHVLQEVYRVLKPGGQFLIALPCEDGLLWNIGRELTTRRQFQKQYKLNYDKVIAYEHVWDYRGILVVLQESKLFHIDAQHMFPFHLPTHHLNLIACIKCLVVK